ncbi:hypothetical protein [Hymenobacter arizonensis]|uniref:Uncharacterized protein n=1 Tax=Hymenobacter arizonensis TaxID=1227077 RepID=A0A1I5SP90_HYMAR|nr:hypothetical protein [Hymenobacter arizonensis]SFP72461.1 hypothetical protein SAMN04515668_0134 [Hymenobacter arizonensis]
MRPIVLLFFALGVGACSGSHEPAHDRTTGTAPAMVQHKIILDVPSLLTLSIDGLNQKIGPHRPVPAGFVDPILVPLAKQNEQLDSTLLFRHKGLALVASYDYRTRRVSNLLLLGSDEDKLMAEANLSLNSERYLVLPVFEANHISNIMGVRVIATQVSQ